MGTIADGPAQFGPPDRVTWNTPVALAFAVADYFAAQNLSWADPCANEGSILVPDVAVMLPTAERREAFEHGLATGTLMRASSHSYLMPRGDRSILYRLADGLTLEWDELAGGLYVNPPYGSRGETGSTPWVVKAAGCKRADVIMLLPARTDTLAFHTHIFPTCDALCFWQGRLKFLGADDPAPFPSVLVYWGANAAEFKKHFDSFGKVIIQP